MAISDNLREIIIRQREILSELETETDILENSNLTKENDALKSELEKISANFFAAKEKLKIISDENHALKNALYEQIYNEKIAISNYVVNRMDIYFKANLEGQLNRLSALENSFQERINIMTDALRDNNIDIRDELYIKLSELSDLLNQKITIARAEVNKNTGVFSENEKAEFESLKNEQIMDEQIKAIAKKNNFESFIGLNLINKLGILLIIIGVIAASQFTYFKLPDILKGIMMFGLGAAMLVLGEVLSRKKANIFSLGITAGGVGVLYVALSVSYFGLTILDMYPAIALCVLITLGAFVLATRYNAQVILIFALIGGYLPMFSISNNTTMIFGAMAYFVVLNLLALIISFNRKWTVASFIGLFLNIAGTAYICFDLYKITDITHRMITILYVLFAFVIYTIIPVIGTYKEKLTFKKADVILIAINTFFSSIIMYCVFDMFHLNDYDGLLAIIFAVVYLLLGRFIETKFKGEKNTQALFYLTGFAFVVLIIPFQFGKAWLSLGWLAEGVALTTYGILKEEKTFKKSGLIVNALCLAAFIIYDLLGYHDFLFAYKYTAITLGSLIILGAFIYKKSLSSSFEKTYKYFCLINLWFFSLYMIDGKLQALLQFKQLNDSYICNALAIATTFLIAYIAPRIRIISDRGVKIISIILYVIGILWLFILNSFNSPIYHTATKTPFSITIIGTVILSIISIISVIALYDLMKCIVMEKRLGIEWFPLIVSGYFVIILTQVLIAQYNLEFSNAIISIIYVVTALAWIIFGFARKYAFIRRFGLGLSILAVIKLFIIDLSGLNEGYRIFSYFALGITLVAISFVYQYFNKRLEMTSFDKENN